MGIVTIFAESVELLNYMSRNNCLANDIRVDRKSLRNFLTKAINASVFQSHFFVRMKCAELTRYEFKAFAAQRIPLGCEFDGLLQVGIELCDKSHFPKLKAAFQRNMEDELGLLTGDPHSAWKEDYMKALGIDPAGPKNILPSTAKIVKDYADIKNQHNLFEIYGLILALEFFIPKEYKAASICRDALFPERFVVNDMDSESTVKEKKRARLYMDDHIIHDEKKHFPDLFHCFEECVINESIYKSVCNGMNKVIQGRSIFYTELNAIPKTEIKKYSK